jgi:hypothetical protein
LDFYKKSISSLLKREDIEVVVINDGETTPSFIQAHRFAYKIVVGPLNGDVVFGDGAGVGARGDVDEDTVNGRPLLVASKIREALAATGMRKIPDDRFVDRRCCSRR